MTVFTVVGDALLEPRMRPDEPVPVKSSDSTLAPQAAPRSRADRPVELAAAAVGCLIADVDAASDRAERGFDEGDGRVRRGGRLAGRDLDAWRKLR